ncbi:hypothetical protein BAUCODRAFT_239929 [Baudoinia panamericana UAMH 10762]|uniref:CCAAT-binding factor domain-containing protein n=1 Tax=Baudoinia panamericana (strain UAMH 10762) TaxID=717646 RepID=M2MPP2_BAUPA|nr:uncharacterized protein BAUCODRAFT_239929 [Baudoinia panamericana UAMH 10762]EMC93413.1 hypothetical protein BAUCODRAFT_239929 [Baudoinia panamericana UAMH 10762]
MPGLVAEPTGVRKRKLDDTAARDVALKSRKAPKTAAAGESTEEKVLRLEEQVLHGREHYNNIVELQRLQRNYETKPRAASLAAVSLCRVFCRLIAADELRKRGGASDADIQIVRWLKARLREYVQSSTEWIGVPDPAQESTALTLLMRIVKVEIAQDVKQAEQAWKTESSTFWRVLKALLEKTEAEGARQEFVERYVEEHDDVRFYTLFVVKQILATSHLDREAATRNAIELLTQIEDVPKSDDDLQHWYGQPPSEGHKQLRSLNAHRKVAQEAWLTIFRSKLTPDQRKRIISVATTHLLPWFSTRSELLTDFLTDTFNASGSLALLALNSIFYLITEKNIDYPEFYTKLYSLLDEDIMHSKHRSRFFRLLETFMSSSHLPAAMVASFMKRLARLSLQAPPAAIVWVVPWVYNMMRQHPSCTFMLHRPYHPAHAIWSAKSEPAEDGMNDPFNPSEGDPNLTGAIDSSLWELESLQSHYHPNVATLAKILGQQFTKDKYNLEDFLDHSYGTLVEAELKKEMKKEPVVEWEIPKRIITTEDGGLDRIGGLLRDALSVA